MSVACVIPWKPGCPHRERAFEWVREHLPYPLLVGEGAEPWVKANAVMPAVAQSSADILILHDADIWCPGLEEAIQAVKDGAAWAMPHTGVFRLSENATERFYKGAAWDSLPLDQPAYKGVEAGGCLVTSRDVFLDCPLDPRFIGWGQDDEAQGLALNCLHGPPVRMKQPLVHLYHPPQERASRRRGSKPSWDHYRRYVNARRDPEAMRALLEEAKRDLEPHQPPLCASPSGSPV